MENNELIPAKTFCVMHNIEVSFIDTLQQHGLIETTIIQEDIFIRPEQMSDLEKYMHLHYDLDINVEGIEAITHLLQRLESIQQQNIFLKNKLNIYDVHTVFIDE